jgi:hypothetical protein
MSSGLFAGHRVLWIHYSDPPDIKGGRNHCCKEMDAALTCVCDQHANPFDCGDQLLVFNDLFEEYGLIVHDGGASYVCIAYCPWCAARLPDSRRDAYFDLLDSLRLDLAAELPERFTKTGWWIEPASDREPPGHGATDHDG